MPYSSIKVLRDGKPAQGVGVRLGFDHFPLSGGLTDTFYTDSSGVAEVEHSSTGTADVYVGGRKVDSFSAPGSTTVDV